MNIIKKHINIRHITGDLCYFRVGEHIIWFDGMDVIFGVFLSTLFGFFGGVLLISW